MGIYWTQPVRFADLNVTWELQLIVINVKLLLVLKTKLESRYKNQDYIKYLGTIQYIAYVRLTEQYWNLEIRLQPVTTRE